MGLMRSTLAVLALLAFVGCNAPDHPQKFGGVITPGGGGVAAGAGISVSGNTVSLNMAGASCPAGSAVTALGASGTGTCTTPIINDYSGTHLEWTDEWMVGTCATSATTGSCGSIYTATAGGAGSTVGGTSGVGTTTRPGIVALLVGTTATGSAVLATGNSPIDFGSGNWSMEWTGGFPTLSNSTDGYAGYVGFGDGQGVVDQVDGCGFLYDERNAAAAPTTGAGNSSNLQKWACYCASNSLRTEYMMDGAVVSDESFTTVNMPVAALTLPNTNIQSLKVVMTLATRAEFYSCTTPSSCTKVCDINTHVPSGSARLTGALMQVRKSVGTTSATGVMDIDRTRVAVDLTSARSP